MLIAERIFPKDSIVVSHQDLRNSYPIWESQPDSLETGRISSTLKKKLGFGYDVLREPLIIQSSLIRNKGSIDQASLEYARENEYTAAFEAVQDSGYLWSNHRQWDPEKQEFLAFGTSFLDLLATGIDHIEEQISAGKPEYRFELERRTAEYNNEKKLQETARQGVLQNSVFFTVSAYPEEISPEVAKELGYKPEERLAKFRFEIFEDRSRRTFEISLEKSDVDAIIELYTDLGVNTSDMTSSLMILQTQAPIGAVKDPFETILGIVKKYDQILEKRTGYKYFCGKEVLTTNGKNYNALFERQRWVREKGQPFIDHIQQLNQDIAESLYNNGQLSPGLIRRLYEWLNASKNIDDFILGEEERRAIRHSLETDNLTREVAFTLKKNELIRIWSMMSCVINQERATQLFGAEFVDNIRGSINFGGSYLNPELLIMARQMASKVNPQFIACGGTVQRENLEGNMFGSTLANARQTLFESNSSIFETGLESSNLNGDVKIRCPQCDERFNYLIPNDLVMINGKRVLQCKGCENCASCWEPIVAASKKSS